jgi:prolyl-tRNA synthetase
MRMSKHFGETLRTTGAEVEVISHQLLLRAGYIRQLASGIFSYLPLGLRAMRKIEAIIRAEIDAIGGQEITMPVVHPAEIWQETGRWYQIGDEMARFKDRGGRDMVLGMTHEEIVTDLSRREIRSYRQLPALLYQIQTKFRDEPRPRAGLIRVREFTMKDSYSLDADQAGLEQQYRNHYHAYFRIFSRVGLPDVIAVKSDTGMMGGKLAHEFMFIAPIGEDTLVLCDGCRYSANQQVALFQKPTPEVEEAKPLEKVATPNASTIKDLCDFLGEPEHKTAKAVFFAAGVADPADANKTKEVVVLSMVRGDMEVNETKLSNSISARWLQPATPEMIRGIGAEPGYASPINITAENAIVVVDELLYNSFNLVSGANEAGYHYRYVNPQRDFNAPIVTDIAAVAEGYPCVRCGTPLRLVRGVEIGNIFQLGTRYTEALGATFLDAEGKSNPVVMGSYGIGVGRLLACMAEVHHDDKGLTLPITIAPYPIYLIRMGQNDAEITEKAESLYAQLTQAGLDVLYDERDVSPGVKFADSDLLGSPIRLTVSKRSLKEGGVEIKRRDQESATYVAVDGVLSAVQTLIAQLTQEAEVRILDIPYPDDEG